MDNILDTYLSNKFLVLAVKPDGSINGMTCGWATAGRLFNRQVFTVYVRRSRYTFEFLDQAEDFYIATSPDQELLKYFGSVSGRDEDKLARFGLRPNFHDSGLRIEGLDNLRRLRKILVLDFAQALMIDGEIDGIYRESRQGHLAFVGELEV